MRGGANRAARQVARGLRWYPRSWRDRYGDEFAELLAAELAERPRSARRTVDLARCGMLARLAALGLAGDRRPADERVRAELALQVVALAGFLVAGVAVWAQLAVGWQWAPPAGPAPGIAFILMSVSALLLGVVGVVATVPVLLAVVRARHSPDRFRLIRPALLVLLAATALVVGARHFANGWPGTGGHPWTDRGIVPGGLAAFGWASTLSVTSYWAHPGALAAFPAGELAWMLLSPPALLVLVAALVTVVRRVELSASALRFEAALGSAGGALMLVFLGGAACWVVDAGPGPRNLYRTGTIDIVALVVMAVSVLVAWCSSRRARLTVLA